MPPTPNLYEIRADLKHVSNRVEEIATRLDKKDAEDKSYREKQIEILAMMSSSFEDLKELRTSLRRIYLFCGIIAGSVSGGTEILARILAP